MASATYLLFPLSLQFWPGDTINLPFSPQQQVPLLCSAGTAIQLGGLLLPGGTFCFNYSVLKPAIPCQNGFQPLRIRTLPVSGIQVMLTDLWYCKQHAQSHLCIEGHLCCPWVHDSFPLFSNRNTTLNSNRCRLQSSWTYISYVCSQSLLPQSTQNMTVVASKHFLQN
jgi:hypothetical protein